MSDDQSVPFDPEKVTLCFMGHCSYEAYWNPGEPFPSGWGTEEDAIKNSHVDKENYDKLLDLYRAAKEQVDSLTAKVNALISERNENAYLRKKINELVDELFVLRGGKQ